jgi:hypothetical protein
MSSFLMISFERVSSFNESIRILDIPQYDCNMFLTTHPTKGNV